MSKSQVDYGKPTVGMTFMSLEMKEHKRRVSCDSCVRRTETAPIELSEPHEVPNQRYLFADIFPDGNFKLADDRPHNGYGRPETQ